MVTVSAPGKVHLMGEHAVVYGRPALLAAVNRRLSVSVSAYAKGLKIETPESPDYIRYAIEFLTQTYKLSAVPDIRIVASSEIPAGYHLGSSAAVAVAVAGAVTYFVKKIWNPVAINQLAYEIEKKQHGNPSGGDNTAVTVGGFIWYRKELEFLKSIWQLPFTLPSALDHFFLADTGKPAETTGEMVALVKKRAEEDPGHMQELFSVNEVQVKRITVALKENKETELLDALRAGQRTLEGMGVVSRSVIPFIREIESLGGAAKILGGGGVSGGVGFLLCYHPKPEKISVLANRSGYTLEQITLGAEGVRLDEK